MGVEEVFCDEVPAPEGEGVGDDGEDGGGEEGADEHGKGGVLEEVKNALAGLATGGHAEDEAAEAVLEVDEEGGGEGVADPGEGNGGREIHASEEGDEAGGGHLEGKGHHGEEGADGTASGEAGAVGLPNLGSEKAVAEAAMEPCAADVFNAGHVAQEAAKSGASPLAGFHGRGFLGTSEEKDGGISACQLVWGHINTGHEED